MKRSALQILGLSIIPTALPLRAATADGAPHAEANKYLRPYIRKGWEMEL